MLSNKVIDYLNKQGVYSEKEDKAYKPKIRNYHPIHD